MWLSRAENQRQCRWLVRCECKGTFRRHAGTCLELPQIVDRIHFLMIVGFQLKATLSSKRPPNVLPSGLPQYRHLLHQASKDSLQSKYASKTGSCILHRHGNDIVTFAIFYWLKANRKKRLHKGMDARSWGS